MKKILFLTLIGFILNGHNAHAQNYTLAVNKLDEFTKEVIRIAPYQAVAARGLLTTTYINLNISRNGNKYFVGFDSQFYSASKSLEDNVIKKGAKIYFKLQNDTIVKAGYDFEDVQPIVTFDNRFSSWRYNINFTFSILETELDKLSKSPMVLIRLENGQETGDFEVREKFRGTSPQLYFMNFIPLLK
jgi:hypothetical protein